MYRNRTISLCLPCRNESEHLKEIIGDIPKFIDEIIIISNKSTDNTVKTARSLGKRVRVFEDNRTIGGIGYGFAHITAIGKAKGQIIVGIDSDGTYPIEDLPEIMDELLAKNLDFISCNRYPIKDNSKIPFKLKFGVWLLNREVQLLYGKRVNDILSGMWVFRSTVKDKLNLTMGEWNLSPQIKLNALLYDQINFAEYNIVQHQRKGQSHQSHYSTGLSHLVWIFKNRWLSAKKLSRDPDVELENA